ncbi:MAG TPA: hypothetical protein VLM85_31115 [Polyangiaceae bacterium]|nr:hypothetical protein [Polyangiaceae bacterium]
MDALATQDIEEDRGLGSAYERYCFYQLVERWAGRYEVKTALEGPLDGMAGVSGVHCVGLARRGIHVTAATATDYKATRARAIYDAAGGGENVDIRVVTDPSCAGELPPSDMVIAYHSLSLVDDWRAYLRIIARLARKVLVVTVCNPKNWGVEAIRLAARLRGQRGVDPPDVWRTEVLAGALWELGRVREHVYFDCPWWPDLQVSAGQSLNDRMKQLFGRRREPFAFTATPNGATLADKFVYGAARWPYFGGPGWTEELLPALLRHPGFDGSRGWLLPRIAHLHAFVVDMRPRTPQARRKLTVPR